MTRGKIIPFQPRQLPPDPLAGCALWCDAGAVGKWTAAPCRARSAKHWAPMAAAALAAMGYIALCIVEPETLWALPAAITLGVLIYGRQEK